MRLTAVVKTCLGCMLCCFAHQALLAQDGLSTRVTSLPGAFLIRKLEAYATKDRSLESRLWRANSLRCNVTPIGNPFSFDAGLRNSFDSGDDT